MLTGLPVIYGIDPYTSETVPSVPLGAIGYSNDGRKFRYCKNNATNAMVAGDVQQAPAEDTGDQNLTVNVAAAIGSKTVSVASATVTANQYADGYLAVTGTAGNGLYYKIKSHPAATAATLVLNLYDPIKVALTTSSTVDLVANPYNGVIINPTTASSSIAGVAMTAVAASSYAWIQTGGPGIVTAGAGTALTVGAEVVASNGTAGSVETGADATDAQSIVGVAITGVAAGESGMVMLTID